VSEAFTTAQADEHGFGRGALRGRTVRREVRGVYLPAWADRSLTVRVDAARRVLPRDVRPDGVTALQLLGVEVGATEPLRFVTAHPHQVRRRGLRVRRSTPAVVESATRPAAAFVAAARELDLVELVAAGDWLVRLDRTTPEELVATAGTVRGPGSAHARRAAALVRRRVDSVRETRLRLALVLAGLPEPEVNPTVRAKGRLVGRVDLLLRRWRIVIEYEGDQHRLDRKQWNRDVWRQECLVEDDHTLVRVTAERMQSPRAVVLGVHQALVERGYVGPEPDFSSEWRTLFATAR
jgi:very-short-patch-repair endonuclease